MANLHDKNAFTDRSLIVTVQKELDNDKGAFLIAQIDQSLKSPEKVASGEAKADSNPYLNSAEKTFQGKDGNDINYIDHSQYYSKGQLDAMRAVAKSTTIEGKEVLGINASLMRNAKKEILINTKKDLGPTKNPHFGAPVLSSQEAVTSAAKVAKAQKDAAKAASKEAEVAVEAPEVAEAEPEA